MELTKRMWCRRPFFYDSNYMVWEEERVIVVPRTRAYILYFTHQYSHNLQVLYLRERGGSSQRVQRSRVVVLY